MLKKHCLQEFILDCQLRRLSQRTVKGYHNNTLNLLRQYRTEKSAIYRQV